MFELVPIELRGRQRVVRFAFGDVARVRLLHTFGSFSGLMDAQARATAGDLSVIAKIVQALLEQHHGALTLAQTGDIIEECGGVGPVIKSLADTLTRLELSDATSLAPTPGRVQ